jgi:hypothetical protein
LITPGAASLAMFLAGMKGKRLMGTNTAIKNDDRTILL